MSWEIRYRASVEKDISRLPAEIRDLVFDAILALSSDPLPAGCKKLKGLKNRLRLKIAKDYRIVYSLFKDQRRIAIEFVGHRKDAYRWV